MKPTSHLTSAQSRRASLSRASVQHSHTQSLVLVLDRSPSMGDCAHHAQSSAIEDLLVATAKFLEDVSNITTCGVDICVVSFSDDVTVEAKFEPASQVRMPHLSVGGNATNLGGAIDLAMDKAFDHITYLSNTGKEPYKPWIVAVTDGRPNLNTAPGFEQRLLDAIQLRRCHFIPVAVGSHGSYDALEQLSPRMKPIVVNASNADNVSFAEFFAFLTRSIQNGVEPSAYIP